MALNGILTWLLGNSINLIVFLIILSILVLVHEFGHFVIGRWAGVGVEEFALGLPFTRALWSRKLKSGMRISLYPVLFGGFVKLLGEESQEKLAHKPVTGKYFYEINVWKRMAVVVAGVSMNVLLAIVAFYLFLSLVGFKVLIPRLADYRFTSPSVTYVAVTYVQKGSPAEGSGLVPGDILTATDGHQFEKVSDFQNYIKQHAGTPVQLTVADISLAKTRTVTATPRVNPPPGEGALGVGIGEAVALQFQTPKQKATSGLSYAWDMLVYNLKVLSHLATQSFQTRNIQPLSESVSGPVGIAGAVGSILTLGGGEAILQLVNLLGILSLSLAFINIMPFPALDGGRLAFLLVEGLTRKKLAARYENWINQAGMVILLILIVLVSFNDISKLVSPLLPH